MVGFNDKPRVGIVQGEFLDGDGCGLRFASMPLSRTESHFNNSSPKHAVHGVEIVEASRRRGTSLRQWVLRRA